MGRPQCVVIGGPNGAGKSTAAPDLLHDTVGIDAFVNADVIAQGLAGFDPDSASFEAGRIVLRRIRELAEARANFALESTLSGRSAAGLLKRLLGMGYDVHVLYLWLPSADLCVARVRLRVESGGHDVPEVVIRRRFQKSLWNFDRIYRLLATVWRIYDSSDIGAPVVIAEGAAEGSIDITDDRKWKAVQALIGEVT